MVGAVASVTGCRYMSAVEGELVEGERVEGELVDGMLSLLSILRGCMLREIPLRGCMLREIQLRGCLTSTHSQSEEQNKVNETGVATVTRYP